MKQYVVVISDMNIWTEDNIGQWVIGPFDDWQSARAWAEQKDPQVWWINELTAPEALTNS